MPTVSAFSTNQTFSANDGATDRITSLSTTFNNLGVPAGATINGFKFTLRLSKASEEHTFNSDGPLLFKVQKGSGDSATLSPAIGLNESLTAVGTDFGDVTVGSSSSLFGISWDSTTANGVTLKFDVEFDDTPEGFFVTADSVQCEVTYTSADPSITLTSGLITLTGGTITI